MDSGVELTFKVKDKTGKCKQIEIMFINDQKVVKKIYSCAKDELLDEFIQKPKELLVPYLYKTFYTKDEQKDYDKLRKSLTNEYSDESLRNIRNSIKQMYDYMKHVPNTPRAYVSKVFCF